MRGESRGDLRSRDAREIASRSMRSPSGPSIQISIGPCTKMVDAKSIASEGTG